jgi:hypothetical protein
MMWTEFTNLKKGLSDGIFWTPYWTAGFQKLAEQLSTLQLDLATDLTTAYV